MNFKSLVKDVYRFARRHPRRVRASFEYKQKEAKRIRGDLRALGCDHPVWSVNDKHDTRRWVASLGLRQPREVAAAARIADLPWATLPERVVLKPVRGASSRGVFLLERHGPGWRDVTTGLSTRPEAVAAEMADLVRRELVSAEVVAEELVVDAVTGGAPPTDWKFYMFDGEVGLVAAKRVRWLPGRVPRWRFRFFDEGWRDLGQACGGHALSTAIGPPRHAEELLAMARDLSCRVARPFLRVDLYDGVEGAVFGEITPAPGIPFRLRTDVDEAMGRLWETAEARLLSRLIRSGALAVAWGREEPAVVRRAAR